MTFDDIQNLIKKTERRFNLEFGDIISKKRDVFTCYARNKVVKVLHESGMNLSEIGRAINRDHTSIYFIVTKKLGSKHDKYKPKKSYGKNGQEVCQRFKNLIPKLKTPLERRCFNIYGRALAPGELAQYKKNPPYIGYARS